MAVDVEKLRRLLAAYSGAETGLHMVQDHHSPRAVPVYKIHGGLGGMNADKVASDVFPGDAEAIVAGMNALPELLTELEQLRASNEQLREGIRNREADELAALHDIDNLRAAARALKDKLPRCPGDVPDWKCGKPATMVHTGPDGDESYSCPEHSFMGSEEPCAWAAELRALEEELEGKGT